MALITFSRRIAVVVLLGVATTAVAGRVIRIPGGAFTVSVDAAGRTAYAANHSAVWVIDVPSRSLTRTLPLDGADRAEPPDATGTLLPVFGFSLAGVLDVATGQQRTLIPSPDEAISNNAFSSATVAAGKLYVTSFNGRVIDVLPLGAGTSATINPYPGSTEGAGNVAGPCGATRSPDQATVLVGDEFHSAVHVIRTLDDVKTSTRAIGFPPCRLFFRDANTIVAVDAGYSFLDPSHGNIATLYLADPNSVPLLLRHRALASINGAAMDASGQRLVVVQGFRHERGSSVPLPAARLAVVDLASRR